MLGGVVLIAYGHRLRRHVKGWRPDPLIAESAAGVLVLALAMVLLFWSATAYAEWSGYQSVSRAQISVVTLPQVTVYSPKRLGLSGIGIRERRSDGPQLQYQYQYDGLRLLNYSERRLLLLPDGWKLGEPVFDLPNDGSLRFEYRR